MAFSDQSDEQLARTLLDLERARDRFRLRHKPFREDAHAGIDESVAAAAAVIDAALVDRIGDLAQPAFLPVIPDIASAWVLATDPDIAARWHALVDERDPTAYDTRTKEEYQTGLAALHADIRAVEQEQRRRDLAARQAELDREMAAP